MRKFLLACVLTVASVAAHAEAILYKDLTPTLTLLLTDTPCNFNGLFAEGAIAMRGDAYAYMYVTADTIVSQHACFMLEDGKVYLSSTNPNRPLIVMSVKEFKLTRAALAALKAGKQ